MRRSFGVLLLALFPCSCATFYPHEEHLSLRDRMIMDEVGSLVEKYAAGEEVKDEHIELLRQMGSRAIGFLEKELENIESPVSGDTVAMLLGLVGDSRSIETLLLYDDFRRRNAKPLRTDDYNDPQGKWSISPAYPPLEAIENIVGEYDYCRYDAILECARLFSIYKTKENRLLLLAAVFLKPFNHNYGPVMDAYSEILREGLRDEDVEVVTKALKVFSWRPYPSAIEHVFEVVRDAPEDVAVMALQALKKQLPEDRNPFRGLERVEAAKWIRANGRKWLNDNMVFLELDENGFIIYREK